MSVWAQVVLILMCVYGVFLGGFAVFQRGFLFPFVETGPAPADLPRTEVRVLPATGDDPPLEVWVTTPLPGKPVLVYFMGFSGALSVHEPRLRAFGAAGYGVVAMAYRGGGGQAGEPGEAAFLRDASRVWRSLDDLVGAPVGADDRVIYGFSLGSGIAVALAAEVEEMALILEAPYDRLCRTVEADFSILPACRILRSDRFDSIDRIGAVDTISYFLHGAEDSVVPIALGRALFVATPEPKFARIYARATHEDLPRFGADQNTIRFLDTLRGDP